MKIGCVILAGGKSSRMGTDKALLKYQGNTFLSHLQQTFQNFEERLLSRNLTSSTCDNWIQISDLHQGIGPMGGIHSALTYAQSDALMVCACDTPYITQALIDKLIQTYHGEDVLLVKTSDERLHPLCGIYHKRILPSLESHIKDGHYRLMKWIETLHYSIIPLDEDESALLVNFNTPKDYETIK